MSLYSSNYLKNLARNKTMNESQRLFSLSSSVHTNFDIFLCHSFLDKEEVEGLYIELTRLGYSVYVDWIIDPSLSRNNVTKETAELIRKRLHSSKSLLLAISTNASISKWMPWELGFVDGHTNNCAIIPVSPDATPPASYNRVEYLSLYPYISKATDTAFRENLWAVDAANKYVVFNEWMNGSKPSYKSSNIF